MKGRTITRVGLACGAFTIFLLAMLATQFFRAPLTSADRASLAARYTRLSDSRLREIAETADPDTQALLKAELARRGAK